MNPLIERHWEQVEPWLEALLDVPAYERAAWLAGRCDDAALRAAVLDLVAAETQGARALDGLRDDVGVPREGSRIGPYKLLNLLGEGGMASVFLAERSTAEFTQRVALKLMRVGLFSTTQVELFRREQKIHAALEHPNIARVFDSGVTAAGVPYFAVEHVDGAPIDRWCDERALGVEARLRLFVDVCEAVQYAHQSLVVHRDLKPSNILVTQSGEPKLLDFGIAKLIAADADAATRTATEQRHLTPAYAAPEQFSGGAITTATDVYALGVLLAELLTGRRPPPANAHDASTQRSASRLIDASPDGAAAAAQRSSEPLPLARRLKGDLDAIVARALAPEPARRYPSAAALAEDVRRHLDGRPVLARPDSLRYRVGKFVLRHRLVLGAAAVAAFALIAGAALAVHGLLEARRGRDAAEAAAAQARVEAQKARQVAEFVRTMLSGVDPDRAKALDTTLLRELLDDAARRAGADLANQPAVLAAVEDVVAGGYAHLGDPARATAHQQAALDAARRAGESAATVASYDVTLATLNAEHGDVEAAVDRATRAIAALPADDPLRAELEAKVAALECDAARYQECYDRYARVLAAQERALGADAHATLETGQGLARAAGDLRRFDEAEALHRRFIERSRAVLGAEHTRTLNTENGLAVLYLKQGKFADAERVLRDLVPRFAKVYGADHPETIVVTSNLGASLRQQKRNAEARPLYQRTLDASRVAFGPDSYRTVTSLHNLGNLLRDEGDLEGAEKLHRDAVARAARAYGETSPNRAQMHGALATILRMQKRYAEAERELDAGWSVIPADMPREHPRVTNLVKGYIDLYTEWGKPELRAQWEARQTAPAPTRP